MVICEACGATSGNKPQEVGEGGKVTIVVGEETLEGLIVSEGKAIDLDTVGAVEVPAAWLVEHLVEIADLRRLAASPLMLTGSSENLAKISEGVAENGDPMYLRAKAALEEIRTFRSVEVEHEADLITRGDQSRAAHYRSGNIEVTLTIHGYTR